MADFWQSEIVGDITVQDMATVAGAAVAGYALGALVDAINSAAAKRTPERSIRRAVLTSFDGPLRWAVVACALAISIDYTTAADLRQWQGQAIFAMALPFALWFALRLNDGLTGLWATKAEGTESSFDDQLVPVVRTGIRVGLWVVAIILVVQNLGGEVGSLLAGFGLGGLAVAMASKDTIANLFGSVVIFVDRPFVVGDWVEIGDHEGVVEEVGLRVTRIRTFQKSLITVPNAQLTTSAINNWSKMHKRRIKMTVGVTYDCTADKLAAAVDAMREVMEATDSIEKGTGVIFFDGFGASSLDIFVYCFAENPEWTDYLATKQNLMLRFMRALEELGVNLAFPTRTVHIVPPELGQALASGGRQAPAAATRPQR